MIDDPPSAVGKTLVIGLGNPIVSDDSAGLRVVEQLKTLLAFCNSIIG